MEKNQEQRENNENLKMKQQRILHKHKKQIESQKS